MDVDLIIATILHFLPRSQTRITREINVQWHQIVTHLYPRKFTWDENSDIISQISQHNEISGSEFTTCDETFCSHSCFQISLLFKKTQNRLYIGFKDLKKHNFIYHLLPFSVKLSAKIVLFRLPKHFSIDRMDHLVVLLKYDSLENTFIDYTDLENLRIFKNNNRFFRSFSPSSFYHALASSLIHNYVHTIYNIRDLGLTTLADFPLTDSTHFSTNIDGKIDILTTFKLQTDGSLFVVHGSDKSLSIYQGGKLLHNIESEIMGFPPSLFVCNRYGVIDCETSFGVYDVYFTQIIMDLPNTSKNFLCGVLTLTSTHFLFLTTEEKLGIKLYYFVNVKNKTFNTTSSELIVVYGSKVHQVSDEKVIIYWHSKKIGVDLNKLCFVDP